MPGESEAQEEGRFIPPAVLRAMRRWSRQDPNAPIRRMLRGWREVVVINDEAHHVYGEKRTRRGEEPACIKWSKILERVSKAARVPLVVDMSATPCRLRGGARRVVDDLEHGAGGPNDRQRLVAGMLVPGKTLPRPSPIGCRISPRVHRRIGNRGRR